MKRLSPHESAIVTTNLSKHYDTVIAVDKIDLEVPSGSIFGFLGPNGAGKTTTIRMLLGFIKPTSGTGSIFDQDVQSDSVASRSSLGFLVPGESWYPHMKGKDQLDFATRLSGRAPVLRDALMTTLGLSEAELDKRIQTYSKGMKQKLALIGAIQHDPELLILDEPTDGLDPLIQHRFEDFLERYRDRGRTVFMSSHDLSEVERTCDRVAVIRKGSLIAQETVAALKRRHRQRLQVEFEVEVPEQIARYGSHIESRDSHTVSMLIEDDINDVLSELARYQIRDLTITPPSLDDIFLQFYDQDQAPSSDYLREEQLVR